MGAAGALRLPILKLIKRDRYIYIHRSRNFGCHNITFESCLAGRVGQALLLAIIHGCCLKYTTITTACICYICAIGIHLEDEAERAHDSWMLMAPKEIKRKFFSRVAGND